MLGRRLDRRLLRVAPAGQRVAQGFLVAKIHPAFFRHPLEIRERRAGRRIHPFRGHGLAFREQAFQDQRAPPGGGFTRRREIFAPEVRHDARGLRRFERKLDHADALGMHGRRRKDALPAEDAPADEPLGFPLPKGTAERAADLPRPQRSALGKQMDEFLCRGSIGCRAGVQEFVYAFRAGSQTRRQHLEQAFVQSRPVGESHPLGELQRLRLEHRLGIDQRFHRLGFRDFRALHRAQHDALHPPPAEGDDHEVAGRDRRKTFGQMVVEDGFGCGREYRDFDEEGHARAVRQMAAEP